MITGIREQSKEAKIRAMNRFCYLTSFLAFPYIFILFAFRYYFSSAIMLLIIGLLLFCVYLNKNRQKEQARMLMVLVTNFSVLYYTLILGFNSGIHLYLFLSPLIVYLIFDMAEKKKVLLNLSTYVVNFILLFLIYKSGNELKPDISEQTTDFLYALNFSFTLILSFVLILHFANNNNYNNELLQNMNSSLMVQQNQLLKEINEKNEARTKLEKSDREKSVLLSETHHRVKNNLAHISGLLELQGFYTKNQNELELLKESSARIKSIALLHEKLYENTAFEKIKIADYLKELLEFIQITYGKKDSVSISSEIDDCEFNMAEALPFGLLINELITNSYKHAFKSKNKGNIRLKLRKEQGLITFKYIDDGDGYNSLNKEKANSIGLNLIETFARQLRANINTVSGQGKGMEFNLSFRLLEDIKK